ncbi:type II CAAX prenyl endopeptidase Rce1 family protein [Parasphingorhabdus sp.]|uniref:CPBP family glutamic-type intramembrane protease n=1 Tax=Parasphingorhabdus sp. TaxID=2709688 RepID=UPI002F92115E
MQIALQQTLAALKNLPERKQWIAAVRLAIPVLVVIAGLGFLSGWLVWAPVDINAKLLVAAAMLFFVPALIEEVIFRGVLLSWLTQLTPRWGAWLSTLLFVAWQPLQALTIGPPWANMFLHPAFWVAILILGIILAHIRIVSRSLWPVVVIHWFAVLIWKSLLGAPFY